MQRLAEARFFEGREEVHSKVFVKHDTYDILIVCGC